MKRYCIILECTDVPGDGKWSATLEYDTAGQEIEFSGSAHPNDVLFFGCLARLLEAHVACDIPRLDLRAVAWGKAPA